MTRMQKMAKFLRERETGGTDFVSSPMASHNMTFIEVWHPKTNERKIWLLRATSAKNSGIFERKRDIFLNLFRGFKWGCLGLPLPFKQIGTRPSLSRDSPNFSFFCRQKKLDFYQWLFTFAHTFYKKQKYEETFIPMEGRMFLIKKRVYDLPPFYRV